MRRSLAASWRKAPNSGRHFWTTPRGARGAQPQADPSAAASSGRRKPAVPPAPPKPTFWNDPNLGSGGPVGGGVTRKAFQPRSPWRWGWGAATDADGANKALGPGQAPEKPKTVWQDSRFLKFPDRVSPAAQAVRDADASQPAGDRRFYRKVEDFREITDSDPYSVLFREKASVIKTRMRAWRRQFEEENAHVEAPYERTNPIFRLTPNFWVRYFLRVRDEGGLSSAKGLHLFMFLVFSLLVFYSYKVYVHPDKAKALRNLQ